MARYSLFVLKMPLNPKQTNRQTIRINTQVGHKSLIVYGVLCFSDVFI